MSRIRLTIDRLVMRGVPPADAAAMARAIEARLSEALADRTARQAWAHPHRTPLLTLGRMPLEPGAAGARSFGAQVAEAIGRGLKP